MSEDPIALKGLSYLEKLGRLVETGALDDMRPHTGESILIGADGLPMRHNGIAIGYAKPGTPEHGKGREIIRNELARIKELLPLYDAQQLRLLEFLARMITELVTLRETRIPDFDPSEIVDVDELDAEWHRKHGTLQ